MKDDLSMLFQHCNVESMLFQCCLKAMSCFNVVSTGTLPMKISNMQIGLRAEHLHMSSCPVWIAKMHRLIGKVDAVRSNKIFYS